MFFEEVSEIGEIARRNGTSVFVVPRETEVEIPGAIVLCPEEKSVITIEQVRGMQANVEKKQVGEMIVVIRPAEQMQETTANALLKTLEEPGEKVHFVLITDRLTQLLPTILSRAAVYFLHSKEDFLGPVAGSEKMKKLARSLLTTSGAGLVETAKAVAKAKAGETKKQALEVLEIAIEMSYKSYFATGKQAFLTKLEKLLVAYENIARGGNIKLQIVASLC